VEPVVRVEKLVKRYAPRGLSRSSREFTAVDSASFSILPGTTFALVGESGSGKSSIGLCMACLERVTAGQIWFEGRDLAVLSDNELRAVRPRVQLVFQDPARSLNPRLTVGQIVAEPLDVQRLGSTDERKAWAVQALARVGLDREYVTRRPAELSGGQRQRVAIARALILKPKLLILDEVLSALDCSVQAQIANLLLELQRDNGLAYLFITHDLQMAAHLADEIAVLRSGRIVEQAPPQNILNGGSKVDANDLNDGESVKAEPVGMVRAR
jgi:ABC-type glutathione transport system ATPase component